MSIFKKPTLAGKINYRRGGVDCSCSGAINEILETYLTLTDYMIDIIQEDTYSKDTGLSKLLRIRMMNCLFDIYEKHGLKLIDLRGNEDDE